MVLCVGIAVISVSADLYILFNASIAHQIAFLEYTGASLLVCDFDTVTEVAKAKDKETFSCGLFGGSLLNWLTVLALDR